MPTGIQSTANMVTAAAQVPSATQQPPAGEQEVLRSGERIGTSAEALKDPNAKTYFHQVPGARFIMPNGLEVCFYGGQVTTNDKEVIAELDKIADKATSMVVSEKARLAQLRAQDAMVAAEAAKAAAQN